MIERLEGSEGRVVGYRVSGKLRNEDYCAMEAEVSALIREHGRIRAVIVLDGFAGWEMASAWEDFRFGIENNGAFERVAVVGESRWQAFLSGVARAFMRGEMKYFERGEVERAWEWAKSGMGGAEEKAVR